MNAEDPAQDVSAQLSILYGAYRHAARDEPLANHVQTISDEITRMLDRGDVTLGDLGEAIDGLTRDAFQIRADRLGAFARSVRGIGSRPEGRDRPVCRIPEARRTRDLRYRLYGTSDLLHVTRGHVGTGRSCRKPGSA